MKSQLIILALCLSFACFAQTPSKEIQIKTAVLAAPEEDRAAAATIYGYNEKNEFVLLRKGTNEMVCLADDPAQNGLNVSCYHKDLHPFMERGRVL